MENKMPEARVRGVTLNYEVIGDRGPWVAFTPGSRRAYAELIVRKLARYSMRKRWLKEGEA